MSTVLIRLARVIALLASVLVAGAAQPASAHSAKEDLVASIVAAPIGGDGAVAGRVTDLVINLDASPDPRSPGRTLLAGRRIRIELPPAFQPVDPALPFLPLGPGCPLPPAGTPLGVCNTVVLLHGWPQRPVLPFDAISASYDRATSTITLTATRDIIASPPAAPGIKQVHLLLSGFRNPHPGRYELRVEAETGPAGAVESGTGSIHVVPHPRPSIAFTSVFNAGRPSPVFQTAAPDEEVVPYDLLLWNSDAAPLTGVTLARANDAHYRLVREGHAVGRVTIIAPPDAEGYELTDGGPSSAIAAPVTGVPTARLNLRFRTGSATGDYLLTFELDGGNEITSLVRVISPGVG